MQKMGFAPQRTIYIGDMAIDIEAGRRAKVKTVAVLTGSSSKKEINQEKPWRMIKNISYLPRLIK
jgi:phosphoglycolate phosphatase